MSFTFPMGLLKSGVNLVESNLGMAPFKKLGLLAVGRSFWPWQGLESLRLGQRDDFETNGRMKSKRVIRHR